jgi:hypothetical protein
VHEIHFSEKVVRSISEPRAKAQGMELNQPLPAEYKIRPREA